MEPSASAPVILPDVAQIAFVVQNLEEAKTFYRDVLEFKFLFDAGRMSFFQCGSVRLMLGEGEHSAVPGGTIVYFRVTDLATAAQTLATRGVRFIQEPHLVARMKSHDLWMAFLQDPAGNTLGLMSEIARTVERGEG